MILNYKDYIQLIKEGLISTHNIEKYSGNLEIELNSVGVKYKLNIISKLVYELEILDSNKLSDDVLEYVVNINQNLLGYYPAYISTGNHRAYELQILYRILLARK